MFEKGDRVEVLTGPFAGFIGDVVEVDLERRRLLVRVILFGRTTTISVDLLNVKRL